MKKYFSLLLLGSLLLAINSCKKCFHCFNDCVQCTITVNSNVFSHVVCRDSFNTVTEYNNAISADTGLGYICLPTASTYDYDFCVNQPGEESYLNYFNKGKKVTCNEK
ncbi:MAG: hypothetical protein U0T74_10220 [Chitinophagales bacterium]